MDILIMKDEHPIVSVKEAREMLGKDAETMSDGEIVDVIGTLDLFAKDALEMARRKISMKKDATDLASLIYDIHKEQENYNNRRV
jgi:hypothetical protein